MKTTVFRGALLGALASLAATAHAVTYQVGPGRSPYTQLTQVAGLLNPGDVVELDGNATYNRVTLTRSGTLAQPIIIRGMAQGAQRPVINGASAGTNGTALQLDTDHYVIEDVVASNASTRCVYLHGHNLTLRRVQVHSCAKHGILGSDQDSGDMLLTEVEVFNQGNQAAPSAFDHPIYISTDQARYPNAVLRIEKSWIHDNYSGNSIKSRAKTLKAFYNWIEATNGQNHTIEAIGPDTSDPAGLCPVPNGTNDANLCTGEIVGNVLIARGLNANMMRLGSDGTGWSNGRYHLVNNTFVANNTFNSTSAAMIRAFGPIQSIELHNNIFWLHLGDSIGIRIVRDAEAEWVGLARRVTGHRNLVTGPAATYTQPGIPADQIAGLTGTIFTSTSGVFRNSNLNSPATLDLRLGSNSVARLTGNVGNTSTAGYQVPNPTNLPALQPPLMRPSPGVFAATTRQQPVDNDGATVSGAIGIGAIEHPSRASLVTHYYQTILRREPDAFGKAFWESEADRVAGLGASINETWFSMAQTFYFSTEYAAFNRDNAGFVTDLYNTFFNRAPDSAGLAHWVGQLASGMPREVALAEFMFSLEFRNFTQAVFGNTAARAEVNAVVDFYRGLLSRLPDSGGFGFWVGRFRTAQCQNTAAVTTEVESISSAFALSGEYTGRARTNAQYVGDLYNSFLRRGGDLGGVQYWIGQLNSSAQTREQLRATFKDSAEFQARVNAIIAQGCLTP